MTIEASPLATVIREWDVEHWTGTAESLLRTLNSIAGDDDRRSRTWPTAPNQLSNALRRVSPILRGYGVDVEFRRDARTRRRLITIKRGENHPSPSFASFSQEAAPSFSQEKSRTSGGVIPPGGTKDGLTQLDSSEGCPESRGNDVSPQKHCQLKDAKDAKDGFPPFFSGKAATAAPSAAGVPVPPDDDEEIL